MTTVPKYFRDANYNQVEYDGSLLTWRVSIYGICIVDQHLLLAKHKEEKYYDLPGGGIDIEESHFEALTREGLEEAGWLLAPIQPVHVISDYFYYTGEKKFFKTLQLFWLTTGEKSSHGPTEPGVEEVVLQPLDKLEELAIFPNALEAIKQVLV